MAIRIGKSVALSVEKIEIASELCGGKRDRLAYRVAKLPEVGAANLRISAKSLQGRSHLHIGTQFERAPRSRRLRHKRHSARQPRQVDVNVVARRRIGWQFLKERLEPDQICRVSL